MITTKLLTDLSILSVVLFAGCDNDEPKPAHTDPVAIPIQTTRMNSVSLAGSSWLAILAGSSITNTGATNITVTLV